MPAYSSKAKREPKLGKTLLEDLHRGDFKRTLRREFQELKEYFLDEHQKSRLKDMGRIKGAIFLTAWLLKTLFLKLTPMRRILLVVSVVLLLSARNSTDNQNNIIILAGLILLFILMLELKDKMLARNELEAGRAVQHALMPERSPLVPGWALWLFTRSANEVGGDLVDFVALQKDRFGVALGDVAGKGLAAALFMAKLQATLRALVPDFTSLAELGAKLNEIFYRDGLPNSFASLVYIELQSNSGKICVLNAGHFPPIVLRRGKIEDMPRGEQALGILPKTTYTEQPINLQKGDLLLIYSDGLTEARNEQGDFFGDERLRELLPEFHTLTAAAVGGRILAEIEQFVGTARAHDDLSMVVLQRMS